MADDDLCPFVVAQDQVFEKVVCELAAGQKRTHWMWFIFPQLSGLGHSEMARRYAIRDIDHAGRYLAHPVLGSRLRECVRLMMGHAGKSAFAILGSPDDAKFRSCLTLFGQAVSNNADKSLFGKALDRFYSGEPDTRTLELLGS
jgi:uncharacterized protein (DUF1810 family)